MSSNASNPTDLNHADLISGIATGLALLKSGDSRDAAAVRQLARGLASGLNHVSKNRRADKAKARLRRRLEEQGQAGALTVA